MVDSMEGRRDETERSSRTIPQRLARDPWPGPGLIVGMGRLASSPARAARCLRRQACRRRTEACRPSGRTVARWPPGSPLHGRTRASSCEFRFGRDRHGRASTASPSDHGAATQSLIPASIADPIMNSKLIKDLAALISIRRGKMSNWNQQTLNALKSDVGLRSPRNVAPRLAASGAGPGPPPSSLTPPPRAPGPPARPRSPSRARWSIFGLAAFALAAARAAGTFRRAHPGPRTSPERTRLWTRLTLHEPTEGRRLLTSPSLPLHKPTRKRSRFADPLPEASGSTLAGAIRYVTIPSAAPYSRPDPRFPLAAEASRNRSRTGLGPVESPPITAGSAPRRIRRTATSVAPPADTSPSPARERTIRPREPGIAMMLLDLREPVSAWSHGAGMMLAIGLTWVFWRRCGRRASTAVRRLRAGQAAAPCSSSGSAWLSATGTAPLYHGVRLSGEPLMRLRRLDHVGIYVLIAGTYTAGRLVADEGLLAAADPGDGLVPGRLLRGEGLVRRHPAHRGSPRLIYLGLGWGVLFCYRELARDLGHRTLLPLPVGGIFYSVGCPHQPDGLARAPAGRLRGP